MGLKKFGASKIFTGESFIENAALIVHDNGKIETLLPLSEAGDDVLFYDGIICPGFINAHCHLELSHFKNLIPPGKGLINFLLEVVKNRNQQSGVPQNIHTQNINLAIKNAAEEMYNNGIVACGDICNTNEATSIKATSKIYWQNFVEVLSLTNNKFYENIKHYEEIRNQIEKTLLASPAKYNTSLTPHAPYTVSIKAFKYINQQTESKIISVHNQESMAEDELFLTGKGEFLKLFKLFGISSSPFSISNKTSIQTWLPYFNNHQTIFLVHNTFMSEKDIVWANHYSSQNNVKLIYCFCPNANLYIENKLPQFNYFIKHNCHCVLGTDSYSSNTQLSILNEMLTIKQIVK